MPHRIKHPTVYFLPFELPLSAADWAREAKDFAVTFPPLAFAVEDWMREASCLVIGVLLLDI